MSDQEGRGPGPATPSRRRLLTTLAATSLTGLAGCSGGDGSDGAPTHTPTATGTPAKTATASPGTDTPSPMPGPLDGPGPSSVDDGGPPGGDEWALTFRDEFDAGELDWDTWEVGFGPSNQKSCAAACALQENVHVDSDIDRLVLTTTPEGADEIPNSKWLADYTTGAVTTGMNFAQTFGYFETKANIPVQPGALPAFWAWGENGNPPEIDFYEVFGESPRTITTTMHVGCGEENALQGSGEMTDVGHRVDDQFQIVGCRWAPDHVAWFVDGREVYRLDGPLYDNCHEPEPLFPILNTHVGGREGDFIGPEDVGDPTQADYPYTHEFDWVRIWQHEDWV